MVGIPLLNQGETWLNCCRLRISSMIPSWSPIFKTYLRIDDVQVTKILAANLIGRRWTCAPLLGGA